MTSQQRALLSAMPSGEAVEAREIRPTPPQTYMATTRRLQALSRSGYVTFTGDGWMLTAKGEAEARRGPVVPRPARPVGKPKPLRARSFSQTHKDPEADRYGQLFQIVRVLRCWLDRERYPGHVCGLGAQGGHTAHHVGRKDEDGLIPGCGAAHDLYAGLGGRETQRVFRKWLREGGVTLEEIGFAYVEDARRSAARGNYQEEELAR